MQKKWTAELNKVKRVCEILPSCMQTPRIVALFTGLDIRRANYILVWLERHRAGQF